MRTAYTGVLYNDNAGGHYANTVVLAMDLFILLNAHLHFTMRHRKEESRWVRCPLCGGKTRTKVYEDTVLIKFPLYCPKCKREIRIDVVKLKMVLSEEPDA